MSSDRRQPDTRALRDALGTFPTGVTVVTCVRPDGSPVGVTANSFVSLSLSPPLVSIALHHQARHLQPFLDSPVFAIHVLCADQHTISTHFARPSDCSWKDVRYHIVPSGHLVLERVAASFLCHLAARYPVGDHILLIGNVDQFSYDPRVEALAFSRGRYGAFQLRSHTPPLEPVDFVTSTLGWG